ncbi:unnamed protein product [Owenia fusiformis]|uniref:Uncharacterized protein n=1 Tax=Owenia fusiformis TaxID=6347 RepID=A0A8J1TGY2_OWEFU|nr:unnamed protein product [Owenia fusiformis]
MTYSDHHRDHLRLHQLNRDRSCLHNGSREKNAGNALVYAEDVERGGPNDSTVVTFDSELDGTTDINPNSRIKDLNLMMNLCSRLKMPSTKHSDAELQGWTTCGLLHQDISSYVINVINSDVYRVSGCRPHTNTTQSCSSSDTKRILDSNKTMRMNRPKGIPERNRPKIANKNPASTASQLDAWSSTLRRSSMGTDPKGSHERNRPKISRSNHASTQTDKPSQWNAGTTLRKSSTGKRGHHQYVPFKYNLHERIDMSRLISQYRELIADTRIIRRGALPFDPHLGEIRSNAFTQNEMPSNVAEQKLMSRKLNHTGQNENLRRCHSNEQNRIIDPGHITSNVYEVPGRRHIRVFEASCKQGDQNTSTCATDQTFANQQKKFEKVRPVVCLSRPSIPSNTHGKVCETGVNTLKYIK